ncbi:acylpyruvate hydrolase [Gammaproteobacteria bacterium]|nr:fumarylacetoacetate hydrolase family protein [Gammaproteobacteria bacterium]QOJ32750.1 MAG: fumarylacetoacetate hydrolase family protein [Gammaproteobacteria bacterium]CAG0943818.1 acylpyruvate hydrolase [Gammaproteobacteria bacterium]
MKFASFRIRGVPGYGLASGDELRPVPATFAARFPDLKSVLAAGMLGAAADAARANPRLPDPAEVAFDPVIPNPGKILCVGVNYLAHIREMGRDPPAHPVIFVRFADSLVGHGQTLVRSRVSTQYDFEGELACVIGRTARHVSPAEALGYVAGYACLMDGSVRDFQRQTSQFTAGKNFPASGAFGPWLATAAEIPDPAALRLETRLNGEVMQAAPTGDMRFGVAELVAYASTFTRLEPGDVIATGTPGGVGFARQPPVWLKAGDVLEVEISGIGVLRNPVVDGD